MFKRTLFAFFAFSSLIFASDEIYWNDPPYSLREEIPKNRYVYHCRRKNFKGDRIVPLNEMPNLEGFAEIHKQAISQYEGREYVLQRVIPTLDCLWNDVIFLSPLHPHKHYGEYQRIGYIDRDILFYKIPIEVLKEKRGTVFKWLSLEKYPKEHPIHDSLESYCDLDFERYQEMDALPQSTIELYEANFDHEHPEKYPKYNWYEIPHILCQDPIDLSDERITIINWKDPID